MTSNEFTNESTHAIFLASKASRHLADQGQKRILYSRTVPSDGPWGFVAPAIEMLFKLFDNCKDL